MDTLSKTFGALADATRRGILARLAEGEATVNQLAEPFPVSLQAISRHLQVLERAGLITRARSAQRRPSRLEFAPLKDVDEWLGTYRRLWQATADRPEAPLRAGAPISQRSYQVEAPARVTIVRLFDAPRERVWKEWTEPSRLADWFGGPETEVPRSSVSIDLKPGGHWRATTLGFGPNRRDIRWRGEYLQVSEPERLAFTICGLADERSPDVVTVSLADVGNGRAEMLFRQYGQRTLEEYELARPQWRAEFDRISDRLAEQAGRG